MDLSDYTSENICHAMGLERFDDPRLVAPCFRLVFRPSFHPEVCITAQRRSDRVAVQVVALQASYFHQGMAGSFVENVTEETTLPSDLFDALLVDAMSVPAGPGVMIDGMPIDILAVSSHERRVTFGHAVEPRRRSFVVNVILAVLPECTMPLVRHALVTVAKYEGVRLEPVSLPEPAHQSRVMVLGMPDERSAFFQLLSRRNSSASKDSDTQQR